MASEVFIPLTVGGGVRNTDNIRDLLLAGADKVSINTAAVFQPEFVKRQQISSDHSALWSRLMQSRLSLVCGRSSHGGRKPTGLDAVEWATRMVSYGAGEILLTSMDRDGTRDGFDLGLTRSVADSVTVPVIASGGVGNLDHLVDGVLEGHAEAVLAASIFHFAKYTIGEGKWPWQTRVLKFVSSEVVTAIHVIGYMPEEAGCLL